MDTFWSRALNLLDEEGWTQGAWSGVSGRGLCLGQVIFRQCMRDGAQQLSDDLTKEAADYAGAKGHWPDPVSRIVYWNDDPKRTFADVEQLLTELHEKALARGGELPQGGEPL